LLPYVERYVQKGYVIIQIDHRFAGNNVNTIAKYHGEELNLLLKKLRMEL